MLDPRMRKSSHQNVTVYILNLLMLVNLLKSGTVSETLANKYLLGTDRRQIIQHISSSCTKCSRPKLAQVIRHCALQINIYLLTLFEVKAKGQYWPLTCYTNHNTMLQAVNIKINSDMHKSQNQIKNVYIYTVSQKTSPTFLAITRESIDGFL